MSAPVREPLRWRPRSYLLLGAAAVLFALGIAERTPVPLLVAFPLLLAPIAAPLVGARGAPKVTATGAVRGKESSVEVTYRFTPEPPTFPADLRVSVAPPSGFRVTVPPRYTASAETLQLELSWNVPDPTVALLPVPDIRWEDALGLVERETEVTGEPLGIERFPPELRRAGVVRLDRTVALPGETRSRAIGATGEFFGIREAQLDDPPRQINWKASARAGRRLANEYALDRTGDVLLLLDTRPTSLGPSVDTRLLGISRAAAYGLADAFLREKTRVGIAVFGEFITALPLSTGRAHRIRIRDLLLATSVAPVAAPAERCAVTLRRYYSRGMTTILLSPLADAESLLLVPHLRRRGFHPVVLSPSYLPLLASSSDLVPEDEAIVGRISRLLRREQVARAWKDAPAIDWEDYWSLGGFVDFLRRPTLRERGI
ncbi:MAG: DUF58 domain-containing protein [Thermoplasmata archaeon]